MRGSERGRAPVPQMCCCVTAISRPRLACCPLSPRPFPLPRPRAAPHLPLPDCTLTVSVMGVCGDEDDGEVYTKRHSLPTSWFQLLGGEKGVFLWANREAHDHAPPSAEAPLSRNPSFTKITWHASAMAAAGSRTLQGLKPARDRSWERLSDMVGRRRVQGWEVGQFEVGPAKVVGRTLVGKP